MIQVENVTRTFGPVVAVDDVSFDIKEGEVVGFLGPNGAGKSTLLKMICTWLPLSDGAIRVAGHDVRTDPHGVRRSLGYLPEHNALYEGMKVERFLRFVGQVRGITGANYRDRLAWVVEKCALGDVLKKWIYQCSKGYRQRIGVAAALLHDPKVILLDEPTHGLDPLQVVAFRDFITGLRKGRAILFSSHILAEVNSISERLLIINHGKLLADTTVKDIERRAKAEQQSTEEAVLDIVRASGGSAGVGAVARKAGVA